MPFTARFVDGISASATVRLTVNDGTTWTLLRDEVDLSPPRLKRGWAGLLTDGETLSWSAFENRVLHLPLVLEASTEALRVAQMQTLARELNRETNFFELDTGVAPVFFRTYRSPDFDLDTGYGANAWKVTLNVYAAPCAVGLREDIGAVTVANNPASANGCYFDLTGIKGDVAAPVVLKDTTGLRQWGALAVRQHGTPSDHVFFAQAESLTLGVNTANPGGGPDAAMSGTGTNNFVRTSFANTNWDGRLEWVLSGGTDAQKRALRGDFRFYVTVRRSDATSGMSVMFSSDNGAAGEQLAVALSTSRQVIDLGVVSFGAAGPARPGLAATEAPVRAPNLNILARRESGSGTLDWDNVFLIPADECALAWWTGGVTLTSLDGVIDSVNEAVYAIENGGDPFAGTADVHDIDGVIVVDGGFPEVMPNQTNRFYLLTSGSGLLPMDGSDVTLTQSISAHYWPHYLYVRPAAS